MGEFSQGVHIALAVAAAEAKRLHAAEVDPEDVVLGVLKLQDLVSSALGPPQGMDAESWAAVTVEASESATVLQAAGLDATLTRRALRRVLRDDRPGGAESFSGHRSARCRAAFELASVQAAKKGASAAGLADLLLAVLLQGSDHVDRAFARVGVDRDRLVAALGDGQVAVASPGSDQDAAESGSSNAARSSADTTPSPTPMLDSLGRDLTALARAGELMPIFGRESEIRTVAQILGKRDKPNAILTGEAGVGKTAVVEGLAQELVTPGINPLLADLRIVEISMSTLVAGTTHRGDFEARMQSLVREASADRNIVLFIDEMHTMVGAGAAGGHDAMDAANILKPALGRGEIRVIGATTTAEYRQYIERSAPLARRFETVIVEEPSPEATLQILLRMAPGFREHYGIELPADVLQRTVELTQRYLPERRFPDKAISVLDAACANRVLATIHVREPVQAGVGDLSVDDVAGVISAATGVAVQELTGDEMERLLQLEAVLGERVLGQPHALRAVADAVRAAKSKVADTRRPSPVATLLFVGATGTGKTELAKALADVLFHDERRLLTFDMSNYQEPHKVSDLIGSPPGYVGSEQEGNLTKKVRTHPSSVVLFDEIEKAHPEILQVLLPVLDEGRLVDNHGRSVNFRDTIVVFTSNLGSDVEKARARPGFWPGDAPQPDRDGSDGGPHQWAAYEQQVLGAISQRLSPELRGRIRDIIVFYPLDRATVGRIIDRLVAALDRRMREQGVEVRVTPAAVDVLLEQAYSPQLGARETKHTFETLVERPLAKLVLGGEAAAGSVVTVTAEHGGIVLAVVTGTPTQIERT
jgi:ATP-dependent Clp protease ATP-binding subunit ClpC